MLTRSATQNDGITSNSDTCAATGGGSTRTTYVCVYHTSVRLWRQASCARSFKGTIQQPQPWRCWVRLQQLGVGRHVAAAAGTGLASLKNAQCTHAAHHAAPTRVLPEPSSTGICFSTAATSDSRMPERLPATCTRAHHEAAAAALRGSAVSAARGRLSCPSQHWRLPREARLRKRACARSCCCNCLLSSCRRLPRGSPAAQALPPAPGSS